MLDNSRHALKAGFMIILVLFACSPALPVGKVDLDKIKMPPGFRINIYAEDVKGARSMALTPDNILFVGTRDEGVVYALADRDFDGVADEKRIVAGGLNTPNGVAFRDGSLYVAEISRILRYDNIVKNLDSPPEPVVVTDRFPSDTHHGWKYMAFGPDGFLYVPVGAPCNVCNPAEGIYATITRVNPENGEIEIYAEGVRNTVGFDWHPRTKELWFTDNGRDWMGDDMPPDELNRAPVKGLHFGFPFCHGKSIPDPEYGTTEGCGMFTAPELELDAHVAALGMKFYRGGMFPEEYRNMIFIAEHGSWNRSIPTGYRITLARFGENGKPEYEIFASGWLQGMKAWGRPVDIAVANDGSILVSDDRAGVIYRITYGSQADFQIKENLWDLKGSLSSAAMPPA